MAYALLDREQVTETLVAEIEILGRMCKAKILDTPLFDADGARMRGMV